MLDGLHRLTPLALHFLQRHGPLAVFLVTMLRTALPVPGPSVVMLAGSLLDPRAGPAWPRLLTLVILPGALGATLGTLPLFALASWGGPPLLRRLGPRLRLSEEALRRAEGYASKNARWWLLLVRATPFVPFSLGSVLAGLARLSAGEFLLWTFLGALPRCAVLGYLGYGMSAAYFVLNRRLNAAWALGLALAALAALLTGWLLARRRR